MSSSGRPIIGRVIAMLLVVTGSCTFLRTPTAFAQAAEPPAVPQISARAAILIDYPAGHILYSKGMHDHVAPASTTKILTALLALQYGNLEDVVTVLPRDLVLGTSMGLKAGEKQTLRNLLYGMLLPSGNDAAMAIARYIGSKPSLPVKSGSPDPVARFVSLMNQKTAELKLTDSHFANPHGLDAPGHYTSAYDLVCFTYLALQNPTFAQIVKQTNVTVPGHTLHNLNKMMALYPGTIGVKTGYTGRAGLCLVTAAQRDGHTVISVVMNAPKWTDDATALLDYGFARQSGIAKASQQAAPRATPPTSVPKPTETPLAAGPSFSADRLLTPSSIPTATPADVYNRGAVESFARSLSSYGVELTSSRSLQIAA